MRQLKIDFRHILILIIFTASIPGFEAKLSPKNVQSKTPNSSKRNGEPKNEEGENRQKPNIIFIMADDYGWDDVSWHNPSMPTKNIHSLAHNHAVILNSSYVMYICSPTRSAFLTGYYPYHIGTQSNVFYGGEPSGVPTNFKFLPEYLKPLGYETAIVGKWHLGYCNTSFIPSGRGFDSFYGYYMGCEDYFSHDLNKKIVPWEYSGLDFWDNLKADWTKNGTYSTELFTDKAVDLIKKPRNASQPLFLYLAYQAVHYPIEVPDAYLKECHQERRDRRRYCGMVKAMDVGVGRIVEALKEAGIYDNTIIVFNNDVRSNGGEIRYGGSNFPLRGMKHTIWEGDGINQWKSILENGPAVRTKMVYNLHSKKNGTIVTAGIRDGAYKLIVGHTGGFNGWYLANTSKSVRPIPKVDRIQLYNLKNDPIELHNLAAEKPARVQRMLRQLSDYARSEHPSCFKNPVQAGNPKNFNGTFSTGFC